MGSVILWLLVVIGAFLLDLLSSSFFFVLFSIGAIVAAICAVIGLEFIVQVIIFAIVSIISLIIGYPILKKYKNLNKRTPLMEEGYIGKKMKAEKDIVDKAQIKVGGEYWTAINDSEIIHSGEEFVITGIDGIKLKIEKV